MTSKPVEVWDLITDLHYMVEQKSKQTAIDNRPKPMSSPINTIEFSSPSSPNIKQMTNTNNVNIILIGKANILQKLTFKQ